MRIFRKLAQLLDVNVAAVADGDALVWDAGAGEWVPGAGGGGGGAPTDATYITQTANGDLDNEQALSSLATGLVKVTNGTGVLSTATGGTDYANASHQHAGEDITSGTVADARIAATIARDSEVTSAISALSSVYQAKDTTLDTYAGIDPSANVQSVLSAADYAAIRTLLGLVIGTNVQAFDADLSTWAGLTPSANAQSLVTAANYAAMRTLLDLEAGTDFPSQTTFDDHSARHEDGGSDEISLTGLSGAPADTVNKALVDAKGDVIVASGADAVARLAVGSDGQVLTADAASTNGVKWAAAAGGGGGLYSAFAYVRDEQSQNTQGGTPTTAGSFGTRVLNTEVYDSAGIVSLSSNQFTLQAGTYLIKARAPFYQAGRAVLRLRNVTDSSTVINGPPIFATDGGNDQAHAFLTARVTIAGAKAFELQYVVGSTGGTTRGLGVEANYSSITEVYAEVEIWKEA